MLKLFSGKLIPLVTQLDVIFKRVLICEKMNPNLKNLLFSLHIFLSE